MTSLALIVRFTTLYIDWLMIKHRSSIWKSNYTKNMHHERVNTAKIQTTWIVLGCCLCGQKITIIYLGEQQQSCGYTPLPLVWGPRLCQASDENILGKHNHNALVTCCWYARGKLIDLFIVGLMRSYITHSACRVRTLEGSRADTIHSPNNSCRRSTYLTKVSIDSTRRPGKQTNKHDHISIIYESGESAFTTWVINFQILVIISKIWTKFWNKSWKYGK